MVTREIAIVNGNREKGNFTGEAFSKAADIESAGYRKVWTGAFQRNRLSSRSFLGFYPLTCRFRRGIPKISGADAVIFGKNEVKSR